MTTTKYNTINMRTVELVRTFKRIERKTSRQVQHAAATVWQELLWRVEQAKREVGL